MLESAINCQPETIVGGESAIAAGEDVSSDCEGHLCAAAVVNGKETAEKRTSGDHRLQPTLADARNDDESDVEGDRRPNDEMVVQDPLKLCNFISSSVNSENSDTVDAIDAPACDLSHEDEGLPVSAGDSDVAAACVRLLRVADEPGLSRVDDAVAAKEQGCDILCNRVANGGFASCNGGRAVDDGGGGDDDEDDNNVDDELVMRLNGSDASVETIVGNHCGEMNAANDLCEYK